MRWHFCTPFLVLSSSEVSKEALLSLLETMLRASSCKISESSGTDFAATLDTFFLQDSYLRTKESFFLLSSRFTLSRTSFIPTVCCRSVRGGSVSHWLHVSELGYLQDWAIFKGFSKNSNLHQLKIGFESVYCSTVHFSDIRSLSLAFWSGLV